MLVYFARPFYLNPTPTETDSRKPYDLKIAIFKKLIERKEADGLLHVLELVEYGNNRGLSPEFPIKVKVVPSHLSVSNWRKVRFEPENIIKSIDPFYISKQEECDAIYEIWKKSVLSTDLMRVDGREKHHFFCCNKETNHYVVKLKRDIDKELKRLKRPAGVPKKFLKRDKMGNWVVVKQ